MALVCHYELLGVHRNASGDEIKKAYRALALRWHPDKNPENQEEATVKFKEIQTAWTVLNNPEERAWYDSHREQILRGQRNGADAADVDVDDLDLTKYFSSSCFDGFGDEADGFYPTYAGKALSSLY